LQLDPLPELLTRSTNLPHTPKRSPNLSEDEKKLAVKNALRYFPQHLHKQLGK
jgi:urocanate hydratase